VADPEDWCGLPRRGMRGEGERSPETILLLSKRKESFSRKGKGSALFDEYAICEVPKGGYFYPRADKRRNKAEKARKAGSSGWDQHVEGARLRKETCCWHEEERHGAGGGIGGSLMGTHLSLGWIREDDVSFVRKRVPSATKDKCSNATEED